MKNFTKIALIITLILVVLGSAFCAVGIGIGFRFPEFWEEVELGKYSIDPDGFPLFRRNEATCVEEGTDHGYYEEAEALEGEAGVSEDIAEEQVIEESWYQSAPIGQSSEDASSQTMSFQWEDLKKIDVEIHAGSLFLLKSTYEDQDKIYVTVEDWNNSGYHANVYADGKTLKIKGDKKLLSKENDGPQITIWLPDKIMEECWLDKIELEQGNGSIFIDTPLIAGKISVAANAGECVVSQKLTATDKLDIVMSAGTLTLSDVETAKLKLSTGVGEIVADRIQSEKADIECGMGTVSAVFEGQESDYSYDVECAMGTIDIGAIHFAGLAGEREIKNPGSKKMDIECGMGSIIISFTKDTEV